MTKKSMAAPSGPTMPDKTVCTGANIYSDGSDPLIKDDSEYPDWLWTLLESPREDISPYEITLDDKPHWRSRNKKYLRDNNKKMKSFK
jgi:large subunit ribosomal protein L54